MKRFLALLGLFPLVWTVDEDGEIRLRVARFSTPWSGKYIVKDGRKVRGISPPRWWCASIIKFNPVLLLPNGRTSGAVYVKSWQEWWGNRKHITFTEASTKGKDEMIDDVIKEIQNL